MTESALRVPDGAASETPRSRWIDDGLDVVASIPSRTWRFTTRAWRDTFAFGAFLVSIAYVTGFAYRAAGFAFFGIAPRAEDLTPLLVYDAMAALMLHFDTFVEEWLGVISGVLSAVEASARALLAMAILGGMVAAFVLIRRLMLPSSAGLPFGADPLRRRVPQHGRWWLRPLGCYIVFCFYAMFWTFGAEVGSLDARAFAAGTTIHRGPIFLHDDAFRPILAVDVARRMPQYASDLERERVFLIAEDGTTFATVDAGRVDAHGRPLVIRLNRSAVLSY